MKFMKKKINLFPLLYYFSPLGNNNTSFISSCLMQNSSVQGSVPIVAQFTNLIADSNGLLTFYIPGQWIN